MTPPIAPRPPLYNGRPVPYELLSPDEFESFLLQALSLLGPLHGFRTEGGALGSGDSGFDQFARRVSDGAGVCIQGKRLTSAFHLNMVGRELAKVALRSAVEGSNVREHVIITSGPVGGTLQSALRSTTRDALVAEGLKAFKDGTDLARVTADAVAAGLDPETTIKTYIQGLDRLEVWSRTTFDGHLGTVWTALMPALERHFSLAAVVREHPRPQFNARGYASAMASNRSERLVTDMDAEPAAMPRNLRSAPSADPLARPKPISVRASEEDMTAIDAVLGTPPRALRILKGVGGGGKSTTLSLAARIGGERFLIDNDRVLPVQVSLKAFATSVHALITRALGIDAGDWLSLPHTMLLLCDGIDEMPPAQYGVAINEIQDLVARGHGCVLSLRDLGLAAPIELAVPCDAWSIAPLHGRQIFDVAGRALSPPQDRAFQDAVRERLHGDYGGQIFTVPFWLAAAGAVFEETNSLPVGKSQLVESLVAYGFRRNQARLATSEPRLAQIPLDTIRALADGVAYRVRVVEQRASVSEAVARSIVRETASELAARGTFGLDGIDDLNAWLLATAYDVLHIDGETASLSHDLIADYLASAALAGTWRQRLDHLKSPIGHDAWAFAAPRLDAAELPEYLRTVAERDLPLAARCAMEIPDPTGRRLVEELAADALMRGGRFDVATGALALSFLRDASAIEKLRAPPRTTENAFYIRRALCLAGDLPMLTEILGEADRFASGPFNSSGGDIALFAEAPPTPALQLARARVDAVEDDGRLAVSVRTIHRYGDASDADRVEALLHKIDEGTTWYAAVSCLNRLAPDRAVRFALNGVAAQDGPLVLRHYRVLSELGVEYDAGPLIDALLGIPLARPPEPGDLHAADELKKILSRSVISSSAESALLLGFQSHPDTRGEIWQVAIARGLPAFDQIAWQSVAAPADPGHGFAAQFASSRDWPRENQLNFGRDGLARARERLKIPGAFEWHGTRLCDYAIDVGLAQDAATIIVEFVAARIDRRIQFVDEKHGRAAGSQGDQGDPLPEAEYIFMKYAFGSILPLVARVAAHVPGELKLKLARAGVGTDENTCAAYRAILRGLPDADIDRVIASYVEQFEQAEALACVAELSGQTAAREEMFRTLSSTLVRVPMYDAVLARTLTALRSRTALESALDALVGDEHGDPQISDRLINAVQRQLTASTARELLPSRIARAESPRIAEVLQFLLDAATRRDG